MADERSGPGPVTVDVESANASAKADSTAGPVSGGPSDGASSASGHDTTSPMVTVVGFHHARGPEVETWYGVEEGSDPAVENDWGLLPFFALSDGAHVSVEDFSYFTLFRPARDGTPATSLFGIACTRQMDAAMLIDRPADVTRSTVQKAVVVICDSPHRFGMLRERLSVVTSAWFAQRDFTDDEILRRFQESLAADELRDGGDDAAEAMREEYVGMSLREMVHDFRWQTLVLFKCCLLQPKMLFFGSRCEKLCMMQFSLISLMPGLLRNLRDCADPELNAYELSLKKPTTVKTSNRMSLLNYMGLPLNLFGKGSLFGPYTPLQQLDILADYGTKSYIVGSTNSLLLQQKDRYSDILINLDDNTINITSPSLRTALALSAADRRWIDFITQSVNDTWDDANPSRPKTMGYVGSEDFIRLQFEEYLLACVSSVKCHNYLSLNAANPKAALPQVDGDPAHDFAVDWVDAWIRSPNYQVWDRNTDSHLFDIVEPKHPCAGGLTMDDVQRRIAEQVKEYGLDERFAVGKEVLGRNLQAGREKANTVFNKLYADVEVYREAQRKKMEEQNKNGEKAPPASIIPADLNGAKQTVQSVGSKAGAYLGSWGAWVGEKRKSGWGKTASPTTSSPPKNLPAVDVSTTKASVEGAQPSEPSRIRPSLEGGIWDADAHASNATSAKRSSWPASVRAPTGHENIEPGAVSALSMQDTAPVDLPSAAARKQGSRRASSPSSKGSGDEATTTNEAASVHATDDEDEHVAAKVHAVAEAMSTPMNTSGAWAEVSLR